MPLLRQPGNTWRLVFRLLTVQRGISLLALRKSSLLGRDWRIAAPVQPRGTEETGC